VENLEEIKNDKMFLDEFHEKRIELLYNQYGCESEVYDAMKELERVEWK